jgi:hypothetical protein
VSDQAKYYRDESGNLPVLGDTPFYNRGAGTWTKITPFMPFMPIYRSFNREMVFFVWAMGETTIALGQPQEEQKSNGRLIR